MKVKKEEMIERMAEYCEVDVSVECQQCDKGEGDFGIDENDFAKELYKKGWRIKNEMILCPRCVKKIKS